MEQKLNKLKAIFLDVDNTALCLKLYNEEGKRVVGFPSDIDWMKYNIRHNAYIYCVAPKGISNLVTQLHDAGVKVYGLTETKNSFELYSKYNRMNECYPGVFQHHGDVIGIADKKLKVIIMEEISDMKGWDPGEVMFIDDDYTTIMQAFAAGFFSMHTTEALERFG